MAATTSAHAATPFALAASYSAHAAVYYAMAATTSAHAATPFAPVATSSASAASYCAKIASPTAQPGGAPPWRSALRGAGPRYAQAVLARWPMQLGASLLRQGRYVTRVLIGALAGGMLRSARLHASAPPAKTGGQPMRAHEREHVPFLQPAMEFDRFDRGSVFPGHSHDPVPASSVHASDRSCGRSASCCSCSSNKLANERKPLYAQVTGWSAMGSEGSGLEGGAWFRTVATRALVRYGPITAGRKACSWTALGPGISWATPRASCSRS